MRPRPCGGGSSNTGPDCPRPRTSGRSLHDAAQGLCRSRHWSGDARASGPRWSGRAPGKRPLPTGCRPADARRALVEAAALVPKGIVCLMSALQFHGLTLQMPEGTGSGNQPRDGLAERRVAETFVSWRRCLQTCLQAATPRVRGLHTRRKGRHAHVRMHERRAGRLDMCACRLVMRARGVLHAGVKALHASEKDHPARVKTGAFVTL
jgi:hypothetical protein